MNDDRNFQFRNFESILIEKKETLMEEYFNRFRKNILGIEQTFNTPFGDKKIVYADWTASGRMYAPIEEKMSETFYNFVGNTHTETTVTGKTMTIAYKEAHKIIKNHVKAGVEDVIITCGTGMTGAVSKLQRILGLKVPEQVMPLITIEPEDKPIIFVTHMEHHSNHTSWLVTLADVVHLEPDVNGLVNMEQLESLLQRFSERKLKIGAFTACSNVTGIQTNYHQLAELMHNYGGYCFVDFAASAPYIDINMHPENPKQKLDAIYFSPHKFLGGPGSAGVLIFDSKLYHNKIPDQPGGGTVKWTNPWGQYSFFEDIEAKEDGGTPGFLQTIRAALAIKLKEEMGVKNILKREDEILGIVFSQLEKINGLHILADNIRHRLAIVSFYIDKIHYNLIVKLLNDLFGIQSRGGCSCAGTYGHYLLHVDISMSNELTNQIENGCYLDKPGWVRLSFHPTTTDEEIYFICDAVKFISDNIQTLEKDYFYNKEMNEFIHKKERNISIETKQEWFHLS